jgi:CRP-like cAMP-binding protein
MAVKWISRFSNTGLLAALPAWALTELAPSVKLRTFQAGDQILAQHEKATTIFLLVDGSVNAVLGIEDGAEFTVQTLSEAGALLGWSVFRPPYRYTASVRGTTDGSVLTIPSAAFKDVFTQSPELEYMVLQETAREMSNRLHASQLNLHREAGPSGQGD